MRAEDVVHVMHSLEDSRVTAWLDGGWAVDAVLGRQTRDHDDVDLIISLKDAAHAKKAMVKAGLADIVDDPPARFVAKDERGRSVDFHVVTFDGDGAGFQALEDGTSFRYPPEGFTGIGSVGGNRFRCLTPEMQMLAHSGYSPDEIDVQDMRLLSERFGIPLPPHYLDRA